MVKVGILIVDDHPLVHECAQVLLASEKFELVNSPNGVANAEGRGDEEILRLGIRRKKQDIETGLTPREDEILSYIGRGESNKSIARALDVTEGTVKVHIKAILKKLGMSNRTKAAIFAYQRGIL